MSADPLAEVRRLAAAAREAEADALAARERRDDAVRDALAAGVSVVELVRASGLHRQRVYQVRDGRR